jgi:hypothetical protein
MPEIFESVMLCAPGGERQYRVFAIQRLNCGLLIDTEYGSMCGQIQYSPITSAALISKAGSL